MVLGTPMDIPGTGHYVSFADTEGNHVSLLQPGRNVICGRRNKIDEPGATNDESRYAKTHAQHLVQ
jgi:hypothetical protein